MTAENRDALQVDFGVPMLLQFVTHFGTLLYYDVDQKSLRHAPGGVAPLNLYCLVEGFRGVEEIGEFELPPVGDPVSFVYLGKPNSTDPIEEVSSAAGPRIELAINDSGKVGLSAAGLYFTAEPNGAVTHSRETCSSWELFTPRLTKMLGDRGGSEGGGSLLNSTYSHLSEGKLYGRLFTRPGGLQVGYTRRRVIVVHHRGNLANKMLQYMGALAMSKRIHHCEIVGVSIPEWGIEVPDDTQTENFAVNIDLMSWDPFRPNLSELAHLANAESSVRILMADHLQRIELLLAAEHYREIFPCESNHSRSFGDDELVINIRTGDIIAGVPHYPILPISFYEDVVKQTGLSPIFIGQLDGCEYVRRLRHSFPDAEFIPSQGARKDFDLLRSARNLVVAVSTFSWLAAWLSSANMIILPLAGFLNPAHLREIDLLPVDDTRYRFFLFPLYFGQGEEDSLEHHARLNGRWKEISPNQLAIIKSGAPFIRPMRENYYHGLPKNQTISSNVAFDSIWYVHEYIDAAAEISEGWFEDPLHHFLEVGRLRGYLPVRPVQPKVAADLSWRRLTAAAQASQSSISPWSRGATVEEDAVRAIDGNFQRDFAFHTAFESEPWWRIDFGRLVRVHSVRIFNRDRATEEVLRRASPLALEISENGSTWSQLARTLPGQIFGGFWSGYPFEWSDKMGACGRFVRVRVLAESALHLSQVEILGSEIDSVG